MSNAYFKTQEVSTNVRFNSFRQASVHRLLSVARHMAPDMTKRLLLRLFSMPLAYKLNALEADCLAQGRPFEVTVNGNPIGYLTKGKHNRLNNGDVFVLDPAILQAGTNTIELEVSTPGYKWGVTNLGVF